MMDGLIIDLFAGGGGASTGIEAALGRPVDYAVNHDAVALAVHKANHPHTYHDKADVWAVDPAKAIGGRRVAIIWASPDCTHFSIAKGGKPRQKKIRSLAWAVVRWAKATKPAVIFLENVTEFQGWGPLRKDGRPDKRFMGKTYRLWRARLEGLGYVVDARVLDASLYGAPTRRRRLFIIARRDGLPIQWPEMTHGKGRAALHTAAECIDWSLPCPSIFERKKSLAEKTLWRIGQGIKRFVIENQKPFIVKVNHGKLDHRTESLDEPMTVVTAQRRGHALVTPYVAGVGGPEYAGEPRPIDTPLGTILKQSNRVVVAPVMVTIDHQSNKKGTTSPEEPLPTTTVENRHAMVAHTMIQTSWGEDMKRNDGRGQAARVLDLDKPLGTVVAGGIKQALIGAFLSRQFGFTPPDERKPGSNWGGVVGQSLEDPTSTVTAKDHHALTAATLMKYRGDPKQEGASLEEPLKTLTSKNHEGITAAHLVKFRGDCHSSQLDLPMPTVTAKGFHIGEVRAFLTAYYGNDLAQGMGQGLDESLRALTAKQRFGLVTVEGVDYQIVDIGMRMLEPHELLRAQFGRFAADYDLSAAKTKTAKVRLIGNSVCPEVAEAIVRANIVVKAAKRRVA